MRNRKIYLVPNDGYEKFYLVVKGLMNIFLQTPSITITNLSTPNIHFTKTTLSSPHDHLFAAIRHQQVSCLCLLKLSATFDNIDHSVLLHHLSSLFLPLYGVERDHRLGLSLSLSLVLLHPLFLLWHATVIIPLPYHFQHLHNTFQHSYQIRVIKSSPLNLNLKSITWYSSTDSTLPMVSMM